jgi:diguanylate cyclase (GGDEF)-like protein
MKALIVDNSHSYALQLAEILSESHIDSDVCTCVDEALEKCEDQKYEFICTSLYLKDGCGLELATQFRARWPASITSIYLITSNEEMYRDRSWVNSGITDVFFKANLERFNLELDSLAKLQVKKNVSGKVLYVEDGRAERMRTTMILENMGMEVEHYDNAEQAWDCFMRKGGFDLVITDLILSGLMTGLSLVRCIRGINTNKEVNDSWIPILGVTGFDDVSRRVDLYSAGIDDYVAKPIIETELVARVSNLIVLKKLFDQVAVQQAELEKQASIDMLSGCLNRRSFLDIAEKYIAQANRNEHCLSLFYLDLDYFKNINDTYGHVEGDEVLVQLGTLLRNDCRDEDVVSRFGGEEFVMLLPECSADDAYRYADSIRKKISNMRKHKAQVTASIGVSTYEPGMSGDIDSLIASADNALLLAKSQGRNRVVFQEHRQVIREIDKAS